MESLFYLETVYQHAINFSLIFTRVLSTIVTISIFRKDMATTRFIISLSAVLSFYVLMLSNQQDSYVNELSFSLLMKTIEQTIIGFATGLILNITFDIFVSAGQITSTQIGLNTASLFDPRFGMVTSLSQFYLILGVIVFLSMNGHLILIESLVKSFKLLPVTKSIDKYFGDMIFQYAKTIFVGGVAISIIIIAITLLTNICLAVMSKFAPQFNLFSVGINMTLMIGLITLYLSFNMIADHGVEYIRDGLSTMAKYYIKLGDA